MSVQKSKNTSSFLLISVIVPVYNAEKYLARCIDSILCQTYSELELILVNDGSVDASSAICDAYAAQDSRVRVIHKSNGGVSAARNDGIQAAQGQYIAFCDNDDFYAPTMLARLLEICLENDCAIAQCRCEKGIAESLPVPTPQSIKVFTNREILESFYTEASIYIWDKLYRRDVWAEVRFPVGLYTDEDVWVVHHLLAAAPKIATTSEKLYYHFRNPKSVMQSGFDVRWASGALDDRVEFARREKLPKLLADTHSKRFYREGYLLVMNRRYNPDMASRRTFAEEHKEMFGRYFREAINVPNVSAKDRIMMTFRRFFPPLYHSYNFLKFRILRGDKTVRYGEVQ